MRFSCLLALGLLLLSFHGFGQSLEEQNKLDSLITSLETMPADTNKVKVFSSIASGKMRISLKEALAYSEEGLKLAHQKNPLETLRWPKGQIHHLALIGTCHSYMGDLNKAMDQFEHAMALAEEIKDRVQVASINNQIGLVYFSRADYPNALKFFRKSLDHAEETQDSLKIAKRLNNIGNAYFSMADYPRALEYHDKSLLIKQQLGDKAGVSSSLENMGLVYMRQADYPRAFEHFQRSLLIRKEINFDAGIIRTLLHIGILYANQSDYSMALKHYEESYRRADSLGERSSMAICLGNMAEIFEDQKDYEKAIEYSQRSLQIKREIQDTRGIAATLDNMGVVFRELADYQKSLEYHNKALQIRDSISDKRGTSITLNNIGLVYMEQGRHQKAREYYQQSLEIAREIGILDMEANTLLNLSESYKAVGKFEEALDFYEQFVVLEDSIYNTENAKKIAQIEEKAKYDQQRQADSTAFILEKIRIEQENQQKLSQRNFLLIGGIGLALFAFIFIRYQQQLRNKENELKLQREQERKQQLEELDKLKSRFFANISHEFRTPLTLILGPASDLYQKAASPSDKEELGLIRNNAQRLLQLVNQILDLSRLESGKFDLKLAHDDIVSFSRRITASFQSMAQNQHIQLKFNSPISHLYVPFDPDILEKIWVNLIANAIKYTPEHGRIMVSIEEQPDRINMKVSDTGVGISAAQLYHVFDRFYQAKTHDYTTHQASTGIGLALVKELIGIHGGEISVESSPDKGATFSFWIPKETSAHRQEDFAIRDSREITNIDLLIPAVHAPSPNSPSTTEATNENRESVLIIEDNPEVRAYLKKCLIEAYQVIEAFDGKEGVEIAIQQIPDLIITDVMMPHKDGFSLTQELKAHKLTHHIPIIILTGKSSRESKLEGLEKEADEFLTKPFDAQELRLRIQGLLNNRKRLQEKYSKRLLLEAKEVEVSSQEAVFLKEAIAIVDQNLGNEDFSIEQMASALHISRVQLFRKLKALTDQSPSRFIRSIRLKRAKQLIEGRAGTIAEVAYMVGFGSPTYFGKCFKEQYGTTPGDLLADETL